MNAPTAYRLTVNGDAPRQYHLHSRWMVDVYMQTYLGLGKQVNLEQLVDGFWQPSLVYENA